MVKEVILDFFDSTKKTYTHTPTKVDFSKSPNVKSSSVSKYLVNSNKMEWEAAKKFNITEDEVLDLICEDNTIDVCEVCGWWMDKVDFSHRNDNRSICFRCARRHRKKKRK